MNAQQLKNSMAIIEQIKKGEWEFKGHYCFSFMPEFTCFTAERKGIELWVANGGFGCEIRNNPQELGVFGFFVWWLAARKEARKLEKKMHRKTTDLTK